MSARLTPDQLGLPPPAHHELIDGDRIVGWTRGDAIGFRGFADETEAAHAAWLAHRALYRRLAARFGGRPVPIDVEPLAIEHQDGLDLILAAGRPIATLIRPGPDSPAGDDSMGFELEIPGHPAELHLRAHAHHIYRTLRKSGIRWALWRSGNASGVPRRNDGPAGDAQANQVIDHTGEFDDVSQRTGDRRWRLFPFSWRRARRLGRGTLGGPGRLRDR